MKIREMRRKDRRLSHEESQGILERGEYGILATVDGEGQPYGLPLSYLWDQGRIYMHCAAEGQKLDNLRANPKASLTVVGPTEPVYDKGFSTYYESAIVCGPVSVVEEADEKYRALYELARKYLPDHLDQADGNIQKFMKRTVVLRLDPELISGKAKKKD